ncbi:MAG: DsbA family protein [Thermoplasmata archaeon]|nr:DsbA family protein [Thermoplasmata archaeon]
MNASEESPRLTLPIGTRDHTQGPATAPTTLLEYGDYECPYCGEAYPIVKAIQKRLGDKLRFVFRNFPLANMHPHATLAAEAAEAVGAHGKFWEMHDTLYEHQGALDPSDLVRYASRLGVATGPFTAELDRHAYAERVREDFSSGVRSGVNGTPTFYINGVRHNGSYELEELLAALEHPPRTGAATSGSLPHSRPPRRRSVA